MYTIFLANIVYNTYNDTLESPEILDRCPICNREVNLIKDLDDTYYIICNTDDLEGGCGLKTGNYKEKAELIIIWNELCER